MFIPCYKKLSSEEQLLVQKYRALLSYTLTGEFIQSAFVTKIYQEENFLHIHRTLFKDPKRILPTIKLDLRHFKDIIFL